MVRIITALSGLVLVVLAVRLAMVPLFPLDKFVEPAISAFEADTGTEVRIGRADLELLPTPRVVAFDVGIELPEGVGTVHADRLLLALNPLPFLSGSAELNGVTVERPVLRLSLGGGDLDPAKAIGALAGLAGRATARHFQAVDGRLVLSVAGTEATLDGVTTSATRTGDADRLSFKAALSGTPVSLTVEAGPGGATRAQFASPAVSLDLDGGLAGGAFAGRLDLSVPDAAALGGPSGSVQLKGAITLSSGRAEMVDATTDILGSTGRLSAALDLVAPRASVDLHAEFGRLPAGSLATLAALATRMGFDPINGAAPFDAGLDLKLAEVDLPNGSIRKLRVTVVDRGGRFGARVDGTAGEGMISGRFDLVPGDDGRRLGASFVAKKVAVGDVAALAGLASPLTGRVDADLRLSAHGRSAEELAATLAIDGAGQLRDGYLELLPLAGQVALPALSDVSADLSLTGLDKPARLTGQAKAPSGLVTFEAAATPRRLIEGGAAPVVAGFDGPVLSADFDGEVDPASLTANGSLTLTSRRFPVLVGVADLPSMASLDGRLEAGVGHLALADARLMLGDSAFGGVLDFASSGDRGRLTGRLSGDTIDIAALAGAVANSLSGTGRPLAVDADLRIEAGGIVAGPVAAAAGPVDLRLDGKGAEIGLPRLSLGGGSGAATLTVRAGDKPAFVLKGNLEGGRLASLAPIIGTATDGEFRLAADIAAEGRTRDALFKSATGSADFSVARGVLDGVDPVALLGRLARAVQRGFGSDAGRVGFDVLSGRLKLAKGIATSDDLAFAAGDLQVSGSGSLRLANGVLDLRLKPKLKGYAEFEALVAIVGPLAEPRLYPDLPGLLADPAWGYGRLATMGGGFAHLVGGDQAPPKLEAVKPDAMTSMIDQLAEPAKPAEAPPVVTAPLAIAAPLPLARPASLKPVPQQEKVAPRTPLLAGGPLDLGALGRPGDGLIPSGGAPAGAPVSSCRPGRDGRCIP
ncbi:AsmA family protein [Pleomorphomonas sp. T1.2MG-36]|uniref:AsmA family protein n=1 Tax=Pleomorphomonas sp. T1.2MG-36 TaxID=3041167 RepID=UPI002540CDB5|nr:AsmA-like C-terminal region-containing protein [Pleomorphomonas sp. T1.2MG-36]